MIGSQPQPQPNKRQDLVKKELERKSQDSIRVANPLEEDWIEYWAGGYGFKIPARGDITLPRYVAVKYVKNMTDHLINLENEDKVKEENSKRKHTGQSFLNAQDREISDLRSDNIDTRKKFLPLLWKGVEKEFGMDLPAATEKPIAKDTRPIDEQLIEQFEKQEITAEPTVEEQLEQTITPPTTPPPPPAPKDQPEPTEEPKKPELELDKPEEEKPRRLSKDLDKLKQPTLRKILRDRGIATDKSDKSSDLRELVLKSDQETNQ